MTLPPQVDDSEAAWCRFAAEASETLQAGGTLPAPLSASFQNVSSLLLALRDARQHEPKAIVSALRAGGRLGRFELIRQVGRGGAGVVFEAHDPALQRTIALKVLHPALAGHPRWRHRFAAEGPALARLRHEHIVRVHEAGDIDGLSYLAMELVPGPDLHAKLANGPLPPLEAAETVAKLADAVAHAHAEGLLHRDLKPQNVLLDARLGPKIIDFGLAAPIEDEHSGITVSGEFVGTPNYLAPESLQGATGPAADVYGLGTILYESLTGRPPFAGSNVALTLTQVRTIDPVPPRSVNPEVPRDLDTVCLACLAKQPEKRYASAAALAADLRAVLAGEPILARPPGTVERLAKWVRRRPTRAAAIAVAAAAIVAGLGLWASFTQRLAAALQRVEVEQAATAHALDAERTALDAEREARAKADKRLQQLRRSNKLMFDTFVDLDVMPIRKKEITFERAFTDRLIKLADLLDGESVGDPRSVAELQLRLGITLMKLGSLEKAAELFTSARTTLAGLKNPANDKMAIAVASNLALTKRRLGKFQDATELMTEVYRYHEATLGPDAPKTLGALSNLIGIRCTMGEWEAVLPQSEQLVARCQRVLGPDSRATLTATVNYAEGLVVAGQCAKAIELLEDAVARGKRIDGENNPRIQRDVGMLGDAWLNYGQPEKAIELLTQSRAGLKMSVGDDHPYTRTAAVNLAKAYLAAGQKEKAPPALESAIAGLTPKDAWTTEREYVLATAAEGFEKAGMPDRAKVCRDLLANTKK